MNGIAHVGLALSLLGLSSCIISGDKCDANQVKLDKGGYLLCVCEPKTAVPDPKGYGCLLCGENEVPKDDVCVCRDGFSKNGKGKCEKSAIGASCKSDAECSAAFPYCADPGGDGYCTVADCKKNADCPAAFTCEVEGSQRFCKKLPNGYGSPCEDHDDCAGSEAMLCDTLMTYTCQLVGCATGDLTCPNEWSCCDYASLGFPISACFQPGQLEDGKCPQGGTLVPP